MTPNSGSLGEKSSDFISVGSLHWLCREVAAALSWLPAWQLGRHRPAMHSVRRALVPPGRSPANH